MLKAFKNKLSVTLFVPLSLIALTIFFLTTAHTGAATLVGALLGIWLAWLLNKHYSDQRREDEYRSLLVSFVHELEEDYHRCALYHTQKQQGSISFSAIFDFNDASTLSKLASLTDNPKIVDAIMYLKKIYFQVGRHVENASKFAAELESIKSNINKHGTTSPQEQAEMRMLQSKASKAQDTALVFFTGAGNDNTTYPKIVDSTLLLIEELKEKWADAAKEFQSRFVKDRKELSVLEKQKRNKKR